MNASNLSITDLSSALPNLSRKITNLLPKRSQILIRSNFLHLFSNFIHWSPQWTMNLLVRIRFTTIACFLECSICIKIADCRQILHSFFVHVSEIFIPLSSGFKELFSRVKNTMSLLSITLHAVFNPTKRILIPDGVLPKTLANRES